MTNVSRPSVIFLVALMMLQPLTSIDYDLEASQEPSFSSTGSESISVSLNQTHAANDDSIMAFVHVQNLSSTSSYSIEWLICLEIGRIPFVLFLRHMSMQMEIMHQQ